MFIRFSTAFSTLDISKDYLPQLGNRFDFSKTGYSFSISGALRGISFYTGCSKNPHNYLLAFAFLPPFINRAFEVELFVIKKTTSKKTTQIHYSFDLIKFTTWNTNVKRVDNDE